MNDSPSSEQLEILEEFVNECGDLLDQLEPTILDLRNLAERQETMTDGQRSILNAIFRLFHSIKGGAGFLSLKLLSATAHGAENLLDLEVRCLTGKCI